MNTAPFFSVVIPVYNKERHIRRAINSVLAQSFHDFELVIVCDPSTDNSDAEVAKLSDPRIRVFHRDNPGPGGYAARNLGIMQARADWVAFLDADDEWLPGHLENYRQIIPEFSDVGLLSAGWTINDDEKHIAQNCRYYVAHHNQPSHRINRLDYLHSVVANQHPVFTSVVCFNKRKLPGALFPEGIENRGGDLYAWLSAVTKCNATIAWSNHIGAIYHVNSDNMVTKTATSGTGLLSRQMYDQFAKGMTLDEIKLLQKYFNRRLRSECLNNLQNGVYEFNLATLSFWRYDLVYATISAVLTLLPGSVALYLWATTKGVLEK